ncbi:hypothetical protein ACG9X2_05175 [Acinetobacter bereziniae]|uniref:hypothetical protein n=1 Tax=Acinetobacter bereziniae TaxID=106648 RepID=UPI003AF648E9
MNKIIAIAIDDYKSHPSGNLNNCLNDIQSIIDILLNKYEYDDSEIIMYTKPEQTTLSYLSSNLSQEFFNSLPSDSILIIYAGHGEYDDNLNIGYWYCSDSEPSDPTTWFNLNHLITIFLKSKAKHIALISDSCFAGSIFEKNRGGGVVALMNNISRQALTSGGVEKVSDGKVGDNSPFNKSVQKILNKNNDMDLSFNTFCEKTILDFPQNRKQTPNYGNLFSAGHQGGSYFFKLKTSGVNLNSNQNFYNNMQLKLEIDNRIKINSNINIPYFIKNELFDEKYANNYLNILGYEIIKNIREFAIDDLEYLIERSSESKFEIESTYIINRIDEEYLSISFSLYENFGTLHPNYYTYAINFRIKPVIQKVELYDVFYFKDIKLDLKNLIIEFSDNQCKELLLRNIDYFDLYKIYFSFDSSFLFIYFTNDLPHAFKACGDLKVPLSKMKFRV